MRQHLAAACLLTIWVVGITACRPDASDAGESESAPTLPTSLRGSSGLIEVLFARSAQSLGAQAPSPRYSASKVEISFDLSTRFVLAPGSDNWAITWGADDNQYTTWGDGGGFGGDNLVGRVSLGFGRVEGSKDDYVGVNVWGGASAENPAIFAGKSVGILSLADRLYFWRGGDESAESAFLFQDLFVSEDDGATWSATGVKFRQSEFENSLGFFALTFLQFGRGYAGSRDDFVYSYANETKSALWSVQRPGEISLIRVDRDSLADSLAYEFFAGFSGGIPLWTSDVEERQPVFSDPDNGVMRTSVSYNPGLGRYFLITQQISRFELGNGHIGIYDAPEPWGPWTTVLFANPWQLGLQDSGPGAKTVFWNFANKWLSPDGRDFVLIYTGAFGDNWATVEGTLVPEPSMWLLQLAASAALCVLSQRIPISARRNSKRWERGMKSSPAIHTKRKQ